MIQSFPVSNDPAIYEAWPDVAMTDSGALVAVFTECEHHGKRDHARIVYARSEDRGRTWTAKKPLSDTRMHEEPSWNNARVMRMADGRIRVICDLVLHSDGMNAHIYLWEGDAEGRTFEGPYDTGCLGYVPDRIVELSPDRWLLTAQRIDKGQGIYQIVCYHSEDAGKHWSEGRVAAQEAELRLCEPSVVMLRDGTLVMLLRENSGQGLDAYKVVSTDSGMTWSPVGRAPLPGCHRPVCGRLLGGGYMVSYRFAQGGKGGWGHWTQNTFIARMDEASMRALERREQWANIRPLAHDGNPRADTGYTGWVQYPDGEIYLVDYLLDDADKAQIRGYAFDESVFGPSKG